MTAEPVRSEWATSDPVLTHYYDTEWGMPVRDEQGVFERLCLESFQSGLSWLTILKKRDGFREAFADFDPEAVARLSDHDMDRLMLNNAIIRNRRKISAAKQNAQATLSLRESGEYRDLADLVWSFMPESSPRAEAASDLPTQSAESEKLAKQLKQHGFTFVGPTTMYALMAAIGIVDLHIVDSHRRGCSGLWNTDGSRRS